MTTEYNHRNSAYEKRYIEAQTQDVVDSRKERELPNPHYKNDVSFYTSIVKHSHLYPNVSHIRPFNLDYTPAKVGALIDKTIEDNKKFAFGPYILDNRQLNYKS